MAKVSSHVKEDEEGKTILYLKLQFEDKLERELKSDLKKGILTASLHTKAYVLLYYLIHIQSNCELLVFFILIADSGDELAMDLVICGLLSEDDREQVTMTIDEQLKLVTWTGE